MAAFVVADVEIHNPEAYEEYRANVLPTVTAYDGKFLVRGGKVETLEGDWHPKRFVILEFPSVARAKQWRASPEYRAIVDHRYRNASSRLIVVEGVAPSGTHP